MKDIYDVVVIGSGFGGAINACRLALAGRSVCILERGKRWGRKDFPRTTGQVARSFWNYKDLGLLDYRAFENIDVLQASGVGGGSLVYFNVHIRTPKGRVVLTIPAGTQPGKTFRLTGQGMPRFKADGFGDLYVKAKVVLPTGLTPEAREAAGKFFDLIDQPDPRARET